MSSSPSKHCNCFPSHNPNLEPETSASGKYEYVVGQYWSRHIRFAHRNIGKGLSSQHTGLQQLCPVPVESLYRPRSHSHYWTPANMPSSGLWIASKRRQRKCSSMNWTHVKANPDEGFRTFTRIPLKGLMQQGEIAVFVMHMALFLHHLLPGPHNTIFWSIQVSGLGGKSMSTTSCCSALLQLQFQQPPPSKQNKSFRG